MQISAHMDDFRRPLLSQQSQIFEDVTAYDFGGPGVNLTGSDRPEQVQAIMAGGSAAVLLAIVPFVAVGGGAAFALTWRKQTLD